MPDATIQRLTGYLPGESSWPNTFLIDRLSALVGNETIEYVDNSLSASPDHDGRVQGRLVVYTATRLFVQTVHPSPDHLEAGHYDLDLSVVPRTAIRALRISQVVRPEQGVLAPQDRPPIQWPADGQVLLDYEGLPRTLELPTLGADHSVEVDAFRKFLPFLSRDLRRP